MRVVRATAYMLAPIASVSDIHLDGLLAWASMRSGLTRSDPTEAIKAPDLPLARWDIGGAWVWAASAWELPSVARIRTERFTKRKDPADLYYLQGNHNRSSGPGKDYLMRHQVVETPSVSWLCQDPTDRKLGRGRLRQLLRMVRQVGRLRRHGYGAIKRWSLEEVDVELHPAMGGKAVRHLPAEFCSWSESTDQGAVAPPYWHPGMIVRRVRAGTRCELRQEVELC